MKHSPHRLSVFVAVVLISVTARFSANADDSLVKIGVLEYPPYSISNKNGEITGAVVEVIRASFVDAGLIPEFKILPYTRSIRLAEKGTLDAVFVNSHTPAEIDLSELHITQLESTFWVRSDDDWKYKDIQSLDSKRVLYVQDYDYSGVSPEYQEYVETSPNIVKIVAGTGFQEKVVAMLVNGRYDVIVEDTAVMNYSLRNFGLVGELVPAGQLPGMTGLHIGFARNDRANEFKEIYDVHFATLLKSGRIKEILDEFGVIRIE